MSRLPDGWAFVSTDECFQQISTTNKKIKTKECKLTGAFPVVDQGASLIAGYIDDEEKLIESDKPLVVFGDHTRAVKWIDFPFVPGADGTKILVPAEFVDARYFYYQLRNIELPDRGYSRHFQFLQSSEFRLAPLNEQKRIAAKLDRLLARINAAKARLDKIPALLKRLRQAILAAATSGKLTEEWRGDIFATTLIKFEDCLESVQIGLIRSSKEQSEERKYPYIKMNNIDNEWGMSTSDITKVDANEDEVNRFSLQEGDLLFNTRNSVELVGKSAVFENGGTEPILYNNNILRIRTNALCDPRYLNIWIKSQDGQRELQSIKSATTSVAAIYQGTLMRIDVSLPEVEEQKEIVRRVEELFTIAERIEVQYRAARARVDRLSQSLLAKAFRGELVPQDPNDEPAAALLERIRANNEQKRSVRRKGRSNN